MSQNRKFEITDARGGAAFAVRVVTRAAASEIVGTQEGGALKIRLKAASAGDSVANDELVALLADKLEVAPNRIEIVAGINNRDKMISVEGITTADLEARFGDLKSEE
ncbi:MAG: DUF167 domain-containing protein [Anaerolineae bacterium]|nr:DUF167 domain-containing protein [Anaerolineae bacterium]